MRDVDDLDGVLLDLAENALGGLGRPERSPAVTTMPSYSERAGTIRVMHVADGRSITVHKRHGGPYVVSTYEADQPHCGPSVEMMTEDRGAVVRWLVVLVCDGGSRRAPGAARDVGEAPMRDRASLA